VSHALEALRAGLILAGAYNAVFATAFAAVAAGLCARADRPGRTTAGVFVLLGGWLLGDGMRVIASVRDLVDGAGALLPSAPQWANVTALVVWGVGSFAIGYAFPAWAGAFVGRRVTWGTGWIAAVAVSVSVSVALQGIAAVLS